MIEIPQLITFSGLVARDLIGTGAEQVAQGDHTHDSDTAWKTPVADVASLPPTGNTDGDTVLALAEDELYQWDVDHWELIGAASWASSISGLDSTYVNVDGDTMTGDLRVNSNIGIGMAPLHELDITGTVRIQSGTGYGDFRRPSDTGLALRIANNYTSIYGTIRGFTLAGDEKISLNSEGDSFLNGGNVGVGSWTEYPFPVNIRGTAAGTVHTALYLKGHSATAGDSVRLAMGVTGADTGYAHATIDAVRGTPSHLSIKAVNTGGTLTEMIQISGDSIGVSTGNLIRAGKFEVYDDSLPFPIVAFNNLAGGEFTGYGIRGWSGGSGSIKSGIVQQRVDSYGTGKLHLLNSDIEDDTNADLGDAVMSFVEGGLAGIGTVSPNSKLTIVDGTKAYTYASAGGTSVGAFRISTGSGLGTDPSLTFGIDDTGYAWIQSLQAGTEFRDLALQASGGKVGVGLVLPASKLHVVGPKVSMQGETQLTVEDDTTAAWGVGGGIAFRGAYTGTSTTSSGAIETYKYSAVDGEYGFGMLLSVRNNGDTGLTDAINISQNGYVGIGTTPYAVTHVHAQDNANNALRVSGYTGFTQNLYEGYLSNTKVFNVDYQGKMTSVSAEPIEGMLTLSSDGSDPIVRVTNSTDLLRVKFGVSAGTAVAFNSTGIIYASTFANISSANNFRFDYGTATSAAVLSRNTADTYPCLVINQSLSGVASTGDICQFQYNDVVKAKVDKDGIITTEAGVLSMKETTTPSSNAGYGELYTKSDDKLYFQDGSGTETEVGAGGGGTKTVILKPIAEDDGLSSGDGVQYFTVPGDMDGMNLTEVGAHVYTASTSGLPTIMIHNATDSNDMLSTAITIDVNEKDSSTAATPPVINTTYDDVSEGDEIRVDVDVTGTNTLGLEVRLSFE